MKESKEQVEKAIIDIAESLGIKTVIHVLLANIGINSTIKEIIFSSFLANPSLFESKPYDILRRYGIEMNLYGFVKFDQPE